MPHAVLHLPNYSNFIRAGEFGVRIILLSMVLGLCAAVLPVSAQALIKINIPRQSLDTALKDFAQQTGLQVGRFSDTVDGSAMVGPVTGELSVEQALMSLLVPSGLSYKKVNERTIAIVPLSAGAEGQGNSSHLLPRGEGENVDADKKSVGQKIRLAQADEKNPGAAGEKIASSDQPAEPRLEEIIVTAQKRVENLQTVPISAQVISGRGLSEQNLNSPG